MKWDKDLMKEIREKIKNDPDSGKKPLSHILKEIQKQRKNKEIEPRKESSEFLKKHKGTLALLGGAALAGIGAYSLHRHIKKEELRKQQEQYQKQIQSFANHHKDTHLPRLLKDYHDKSVTIDEAADSLKRVSGILHTLASDERYSPQIIGTLYEYKKNLEEGKHEEANKAKYALLVSLAQAGLNEHDLNTANMLISHDSGILAYADPQKPGTFHASIAAVHRSITDAITSGDIYEHEWGPVTRAKYKVLGVLQKAKERIKSPFRRR